jgi:nicotinamide phosphoribosyltransferase
MKMIHDAFEREFFKVDVETALKNFRSQVCYFSGGSYDDSHIVSLHKLGYLPIRVKSLKEGSLMKAKIPGLTMINTHKDFAWVTGYLETVISNETWKSVNNATIALAYRRLLAAAALETVGNTDFVKWQCHDFSARGMSGSADAARQGMCHLTCFYGSDAIGSTAMVVDYYNAPFGSFIAGSVNASEHMTETLAIQTIAKRNNISLNEAEYIQMKRLITEVYPSGIVARVCDSYDYWNVITDIVPRLKEDILNRAPDSLGMSKVVIRPDSGDPVQIICGIAIPVKTLTDVERWFKNNPSVNTFVFVNTTVELGVYTNSYMVCTVTDEGILSTPIQDELVTPEMKGTVECLWETFGGTITEKGYRLLDSHIGMIYGDSITVKRALDITNRLKAKGFASTNVIVAAGSFTYNYSTRDTLGMALKATYAIVDGEPINLNKDPKTDDGTKKSAKGLVRVECIDNELVLFDEQSAEQEEQGLLVKVYEDGLFYNISTFDEIRARIDSVI